MSKTGKYLLIDTETTGLSPSKHALIQLAAAALDKDLNIIDTICFDVNPGEGFVWDAEAFEVNGFTLERIAEGCSYKEAREKFMQFYKKNFNTKPIAVAQFWPFDFAVMEKLFAEGEDVKYFSREILGNDFIDTKAIVNFANLKAQMAGKEPPFPITSLSKKGGLKDTLAVGQNEQAHDALGDVMATREVLLKLVNLDNNY